MTFEYLIKIWPKFGRSVKFAQKFERIDYNFAQNLMRSKSHFEVGFRRYTPWKSTGGGAQLPRTLSAVFLAKV